MNEHLQNKDLNQDLRPLANSKKVFVKTYGCQMNVYDSQRMTDSLGESGYQPTDTVEDADLVLINTCHIREKAAEKVYSQLGRLQKMKRERAKSGRELMVGVAGCVAQAEGSEIIRRAPVVDLVIGPTTYHRLPEALDKARSGTKVVETDYAVEDKFEYLPEINREKTISRGVTAFLTVQEGCDKFCTFCVVPYTRGSEVSRPLSQILTEANRLVDAGVKEITLLGQNVNAWHGHGPDGSAWGLGDLLYHLAEIDGIKRLRYTTSHPRDMDDKLIEAHRDLDKLMPYLHLPPDLAISGDFITGFPGETAADFEATMRLVETVGYAQAFSFKYSPRPGTPGADLPDHVPEEVKAERLERLQALLFRQQTEFQQSMAGREFEVLVEKPGRFEHQMVGRSPWLLPVIIEMKADDNLEIGDIMKVRITKAGTNSLHAERAG
jgi:tRNA-2-methylthio-N6-dimethylallyladenosine synthase